MSSQCVMGLCTMPIKDMAPKQKSTRIKKYGFRKHLQKIILTQKPNKGSSVRYCKV
jgi:hypothetical protein